MTIKIYNQEEADGIANIIRANASIVLQCKLTSVETTDQDVAQKAIASIEGDKPSVNDLYYIKSILASVGTNKNDDHFTAEDLWIARSTPIHKRFNFMHDEEDIIGVITNSYVVDSFGEKVESEENISSISDIVSEAVIWTEWDDDRKKARFQNIIDSVETGKMFVSMENLYREFDYLIDGEVVKRDKSTAFLSKYLRKFGGKGFYDDKKINLVIRNMTFSGKGLVTKPANPRSLILETKAMEKEMADDNVEKLVAAEAAKVSAESAKATAEDKLATAMKELDEAKAKIVEVEKQRDSLAQEVKDVKASMEEKETSYASEVEALEKDLEASKAKVADLENEKVLIERQTKLVKANVDESKIADIIKTWASASDEQFEEIVQLYSGKSSVSADKSEDKSEDDFNEDVTGGKASEDAQDPADLKKKEEDKSDEVTKSLASEISNLIGLTKGGE